MKFQRWWLPIAPVCLLGCFIAFFPSWQTALQHFSKKNNQPDWNKPPISQAVSTPKATSSQFPATTLQQQVTPAVVTIYGAEGLGSGMIVRSQGLVLTNKHIVDRTVTLNLKTATGEIMQGTVVDFDLRYDLALVQITAPRRNLPTVKLADSVTLKPGDRVYAIGSPSGKAGTLTSGTFTRLTQHGSLQTSAGLLNAGNSGGPLLTGDGLVIGVNKGLLEDKSGLATPISAVKALLKRYEAVNHQPDRLQ